MKVILVDAVGTFVDETGVVDQKLHALLETYPNRKLIVTNANDEEAVQFGLDKVPYEVFSMKHQPNKTDPRFFETLMGKYGLKPDELIYFEHNGDAVKNAESVGIRSYFFDEQTRDLEGLKRFLDENL